MRLLGWVTPVVLGSAAMSVVGIFALVACVPAPSAPPTVNNVNEEPTQTVEPTLAPDAECYEMQHPAKDEIITICPSMGPRAVDHDLREKYNRYMEGRAAKLRRGEPVESVYVHVVVITDTPDAEDVLVNFLEQHTVESVVLDAGDETAVQDVGTAAWVNIDVVPEISVLAGVRLIYED